jgi:hypothetical protein
MTATSAFGLRAGNYIPAIWKIRHASRGDKSKRAYDGYLKLIEVTFGSTPIGALEDKRARGDFKEFVIILRHAAQGVLRARGVSD